MGEDVVAVIRKILLAILVLGILGSGAELVLIGHFEDLRQWIPLVLLALGLIICTWQSLCGGAAALTTLRWLMIAFVVSGAVGSYFHYQGAAEFKLESNPQLSGWTLFLATIGAKNPPLLAPGVMIQLGLLGLTFMYKHPAQRRRN